MCSKKCQWRFFYLFIFCFALSGDPGVRPVCVLGSTTCQLCDLGLVNFSTPWFSHLYCGASGNTYMIAFSGIIHVKQIIKEASVNDNYYIIDIILLLLLFITRYSISLALKQQNIVQTQLTSCVTSLLTVRVYLLIRLGEVDHALLCLHTVWWKFCCGSFFCVFSLRASHISFFGSGDYDVKVCTFQCLFQTLLQLDTGIN